MKDFIQEQVKIYEGKKFIRGLHGVPDFPPYQSSLPEDWFWEEGSKKEDNHFLWHESWQTDSTKWNRDLNIK